MSLFVALLVGAIIGTVGGYLLQENIELLLLDLFMGIGGAIIGLAFYFFIGTSAQGLSLFSWAGTVCSALGAAIFVLIFSALHKISPRTPPPEETRQKAEKKASKDEASRKNS